MDKMLNAGLPVKVIVRNEISKTLLESFTKDCDVVKGSLVIDEQDLCKPDDLYGISKYEAEQVLCELFAKQMNT